MLQAKKTSSPIKEAGPKTKKITFSDKVQSQTIIGQQVDESTLGAVGGFGELDPNLLNSTRSTLPTSQQSNTGNINNGPSTKQLIAQYVRDFFKKNQ